MGRHLQTFTIPNPSVFKQNILDWAQKSETLLCLDSNETDHLYPNFDAVFAIDVVTELTATENAFEQLQMYRKTTKDWIFGYLSYDLKNDIEVLSSANKDELSFPELYFFQPKKIIFIQGHRATFAYYSTICDEIEADCKEILNAQTLTTTPTCEEQYRFNIQARIGKDEYLSRVQDILAHIQRGDIYEVNFCQEFYASEAVLNALKSYKKLNAISKAPFSAFFKHKEHYLLCASPERYLKKEGEKIISQPIKGTAKRDADPQKDNRLKAALEAHPKERAENIMIVDLVRNDLAKIAQKGSVLVEELCKVYSFDQLHQMISTISCTVPPNTDPVTVIKATFPMGSMTGAPKISAMKIIEQSEITKRGLYSGILGYFSPEANFDFNVVIRSILYNAAKKYVSYSVGSAITAKSLPEDEYEECLAKAAAMQQALMENA